jgi:hypothetical protein
LLAAALGLFMFTFLLIAELPGFAFSLLASSALVVVVVELVTTVELVKVEFITVSELLAAFAELLAVFAELLAVFAELLAGELSTGEFVTVEFVTVVELVIVVELVTVVEFVVVELVTIVEEAWKLENLAFALALLAKRKRV